MTLIYQIPRNCLTWLLVAQVFLIAPHIPHIPRWTLLVWLLIVVWRVQVYRGHWSFPSRRWKYAIVFFCLAGLLAEYRRFYGLEPMIGLLIIAFLLKLLEMHQRRDAVSVIYIGYFVAATEFLFSQSLQMTAYVALCLTLVTCSLIALNQSDHHQALGRTFKLASKLVLQSIPMMLVLFLIIPRIGSLWAVPQQQNAAKTGVSDSMSPGDFSRLSRSTKTAFRVTFDGDIPPTNQLYWRAMVFSRFDGRTWNQSMLIDFAEGGPINWSGEAPLSWQQQIEAVGQATSYDIILEPTQENWLYALAVPQAQNDGIGLTRDFNLMKRTPVRNRFRYRVRSYLEHYVDRQGLTSLQRRRELQLPRDINPESLARAREWREQASSDAAYINRILDYYRREFVYTLDPPLLGRNSVDEFLWQTKRGFCEHFASSFVFMMRAAGIPARVVVGYQGGERNPLENFLIVKQSDAHAWAEVWLDGEGWRRVDPTAAVAPNRIEYGLADAVSEADARLIDIPFLANYSSVALLNILRLRLEVLNYQWSSWVVSYDQESQTGLLRRLLGDITALRIALVLVVAGGIVLGAIGLTVLLSGRAIRRERGDRLYHTFLRRLQAGGVIKQPGEGPRTFAARAASEQPQWRQWIWRVTELYESYAYRGDQSAVLLLEQAVDRRHRPRKRFSVGH